MMAGAASAQVTVFAAGSLRAPLTEAARAFEATAAGAPVQLVFGASGLLLDRIRNGEPAQVFASANMEHPRTLAAAGGWSAVRAFTRNALCALVGPGIDVTTDSLVARMLDPAVRVGTSTPKADPSGDYAFEMFAKTGASGPALQAKALQLTGGPSSPPPPAGRSVYGMLVASGSADVFITYCTNAVAAMREEPQLRIVQVPQRLNVVADYGLSVREGAPPAAAGFAAFLLSPPGQALLAKYGFHAPP